MDYKEHNVAPVVAQPPLIYAAGLGLGLAIQAVRPMRLLPRAARPLRRPLGALLILGAVADGVWAATTMLRAGTDPHVRHPATALVVSGPFRYSRNPIYLGLTAFYLGVSLLRNALWPVLLLPAVLQIMQRGVIEREERYLALRFGEEYLAYRRRVPRWF